jgi:hypothetical protein
MSGLRLWLAQFSCNWLDGHDAFGCVFMADWSGVTHRFPAGWEKCKGYCHRCYATHDNKPPCEACVGWARRMLRPRGAQDGG